MKIQGIDFHQQVSQGDVTFTRVDRLPDGVVEVKRDPRGRLLVTHSETGHHHSLVAPDARLLESPGGLVAYLVAGKEYADVEHERSYDTHETVRFIAGIWRVDRQEENSPSGWRRVED